ncbi:MAG: hypothetical protein KDD41_11135, partial [Flavobacteriales bacterium]|nr:hypothetical protein [Flavobacteriales bacterium]
MKVTLIIIALILISTEFYGQRVYDDLAVNKYKLNFSPTTKRYKKLIEKPQAFPETLDSLSIYLLCYHEKHTEEKSYI